MLGRIENADTWKSLEMTAVEGKDTRHGIDLHDGSEMGIMSLLARNALGKHDPLPCFRHFRRVWQQQKEAPQGSDFISRSRDSHV